jgi:hypothetical protein
VNLSGAMDELAAALDTIDGLRTYSYAVGRINPPAALVTWPEEIIYDQAMQRGADSMTLPVLVLVGGVDARSSRDLLGAYLAGAGPYSVKAAIDGYSYIELDSARVSTAKVDTVTVADVEYLGALFDVEIFGRGA